MKRWLAVSLLLIAACARSDQAAPVPVITASGVDLSALDQGWSAAVRNEFYTTGQGSRLMPYAWFAALRRTDSGAFFGQDQLARYGYLPLATSSDLPIGFVVDTASGDLGLTCAACHTGVLTYKGQSWRIDGGRAGADFQRFLTDLAAAARATIDQPDRLRAFVAKVAGPSATDSQKAELTEKFSIWARNFGYFMDRSLPSTGWGPGRLDAFGMIFNRVTALDLAVPKNYRVADAPVRYPFLWNASRQDRTQWNGTAPNGTHVKAMARNTGEVFGVFALFEPQVIGAQQPPSPGWSVLQTIDYGNSADFPNLETLERNVVLLRPPPWPRAVFGLDDAAATRGAAMFDAICASCHGVRASKTVPGAWATPVCRVGTDPGMYQNALLTGRSGDLRGSVQLSTGGVLGDPDQKVAILANAVIGSLLRDALREDRGIWEAIRQDARDGQGALPPAALPADPRWSLPAECDDAAQRGANAFLVPDIGDAAGMVVKETTDLYVLPSLQAATGASSDAAYEARVLNGVWAAAPFLHNGSVPSLKELLKPARDRTRKFSVATHEFDPVSVGLAVIPAGVGDFDLNAGSGNSNSGHEYGTTLPPSAQSDLLEYLKTL